MTSLVSFERVFEVLDAPDPITERPGAVDLVAPRGRVDVRATSASATRRPTRRASRSLEQHPPAADPDRDVLDGVDLDVLPGETVALVGVSGGGKSTLVSLDPPALRRDRAGACSSTGTTCATSRCASLRAAIGVVAQDPHLFHESIGDNLRYAKPDATDDELRGGVPGGAHPRHDRRAARTASTPSSATAATACPAARSSAWRSPACCSRTRPIVILDEATSHLDNDNEQHVQAALDAALFGRTAIVIAHRLSTIRHADRIAVIEDGRIVELGTHDELVALRRSLRRPAARGRLGARDRRPGRPVTP